MIPLYFSTLFLIAANILLAVLKKQKIAGLFGIPALISAAASVVLVYVNSGHLPMSGTFEKMQNIVLIIMALGVFYNLRNRKEGFYSFEFLFIAFFFQAFVLFDELKVDDFFYMYDNAFVAMFFQLRLSSVALIAFALSQYIAALRYGDDAKTREKIRHRARNFTLLGAIIFLSGEFSGSVWAQTAYGDAWRWSKNFFMSGGMFLLALLGSHLNPEWLKSWKKQIYLSALPLLIIIALFIS